MFPFHFSDINYAANLKQVRLGWSTDFGQYPGNAAVSLRGREGLNKYLLPARLRTASAKQGSLAGLCFLCSLRKIAYSPITTRIDFVKILSSFRI